MKKLATTGEAAVAVVTGGGQGIGRAVAERLLADGYRVAVFEKDERARTLVNKVWSEALREERVAVLDVDVSKEASVARGIARVLKRFGRLDALVNNAGIANPYNAPI